MIQSVKKILFSLLLPLLLASVLTACFAPTPNADATAIADAYIRTQAAESVRLTLTASVVTVEASATPTLQPTVTPTPTLVPFTDTPQPTATQTPEPQINCTDKAKFVEETVPDNSQFQPGQAITKSWTLQNVGTCTWTTAYSINFKSGERMGAPESTLLTQAVAPQSNVTLTVNLTAPSQPGVYQSDFMLKNSSGVSFGVGRNADLAIWAKIAVVETDSSLDLGDPTYAEKFDVTSGLWPVFLDSQTNYEIKNGSLVVSALQQTGDLWRVVAYPAVTNQYIQAVFKTTESCTGKNSYGFALRSYAQGDSVYDSGYFLAVSCDGMYRVYSLVNGTFTSIKDWTAAENLLKGNNQTNKVGLMAKDNQFTVYINGIKVATFSDSSHTQGQFGILIRASEAAPFIINVDEFTYWELK